MDSTLGRTRRPRARGVRAGAMIAIVSLVTACSGGGGETPDEPTGADGDQPTGSVPDATQGDGPASPTGSVAATSTSADQARDGGVVRVDWVADPPSLDPLRFNSLATWLTYSLVYSPVLDYDADGQLVPELASELPTISDDGLRYEIPIRDDVVFHDGSELSAEDVAFTYELVRDTENSSVWSSAMSTVDTIEVEDDTVVLNLATPYSPLAGMLTRIHILSADTEYDPNETWANTMMGTGPFRFVSWDPGTSIVLERNEDYYKPDLPHLDGVEIHIVPEDATRIANMANGISHIMPVVPYTQIEVVESRGVPVNVPDDSALLPTIWPSLQEGRPTTDVNFRKAVTMAIDRGQLIEQVYAGHADVASTIHASGFDYWNEELGTTLGDTADIDGAMAALAEYEGELRPIELVHRNEPVSTAMATIIQSNLAEIGLDVQLSAEEAASYFPKLLAGDFDLMLLSIEGGPASARTPHLVHGALHSDSAANYHSFSDPTIDELLTTAVGAMDDPEEAWAAVQARELEIVPYISTVTARYTEGVSPALHDYQTSSLITLRGLESAWLEQ